MKQKKKNQHKKSGTGFSLGFTFFNLVVFILIPLIFVSASVDGVQPVRLLVLSSFLFLFGAVLFFSRSNDVPVSVWNNPLIWLVAAFMLITIGSMAFAVNIKETYFDIARVITFFVFTLFTATVLFDTEKRLEQIAGYVVVAASISVTIGIYQFVTIVLWHETGFLPDGRPIIYEIKGMMAHKNQYAINLMLMLPVVLYGSFTFNQKTWKRYAAIVSVLIVLLIILVQTRSVWMALIISTSMLTVAAFIKYKALYLSLRQRNLLFVSVFSIVLMIVFVIIFVPEKDEFSRLGQLKSIAHPEAGNNKYRLKIWNVTADMIADHPYTGIGAGNWKLRAAEYFSGHDLKKNQLNWLRPHNDLLWVFAEKGIFGALVYLGMFLMTLYYLFIAFLRNEEKNDRLLALLIAGGLIGYQVTAMFSFPLERINQQIFLHLFMATAICLFVKTQHKNSSKRINRKVFFVAALLLLFPIIYSSSIVKSDFRIVKARTLLHREDWSNMVFEALKAETWARNLDPEATPLEWYKGIGFSRLNQPQKAIASYRNALRAHPNKTTVLHNLGVVYTKIGDYHSAIDCFEKVLAILPDDRESLEALSSVYFEQADYHKSFLMLKEIKHGQRTETIKANMQALRRIMLGLVLDEAVNLSNEGREAESWQRFDSAVRIYESPDRFLMMLDNDHAGKFDESTLLKLLRLVPYPERPEAYQQRIEQLKINIGDANF
jgi:O-antigen ligase